MEKLHSFFDILYFLETQEEKEIKDKIENKIIDPNMKDGSGESLLHYYTFHSELEIIKILLDSGADINIRNNFLETPLHIAEKYGINRVALLLLEKGADVKVEDINCITLAQSICQYLSEHRLNDRCVLVDIDETELMKRLIIYRDRGYIFDDPKFLLACPMNVNFWNFFIDGGMDVNSEFQFIPLSHKKSLLHIACDSDYDFVNFLLENGANPNSISSKGMTPLDMAIKKYIKQRLMSENLISFKKLIFLMIDYGAESKLLEKIDDMDVNSFRNSFSRELMRFILGDYSISELDSIIKDFKKVLREAREKGNVNIKPAK